MYISQKVFSKLKDRAKGAVYKTKNIDYFNTKLMDNKTRKLNTVRLKQINIAIEYTNVK